MVPWGGFCQACQTALGKGPDLLPPATGEQLAAQFDACFTPDTELVEDTGAGIDEETGHAAE